MNLINNRIVLSIYLFFVCFIFVGCNNELQDTVVEVTEYMLAEIEILEEKESEIEVLENIFEEIDSTIAKNISINYPQISGLIDADKQIRINNLIKKSALEPYYYYLERESNDNSFDFVNTSLFVRYEIILTNERIFSVRFKGDIYTKGGAHGTSLGYAVNIDLKTGQRINVNELFQESFIEKITQNIFDGDIADDYIDFIENAMISQRDDFVDSYNNFYFTEDNFYIIVIIPDAQSTRWSFSSSHEDLKSSMRIENPIWNAILGTR